MNIQIRNTSQYTHPRRQSFGAIPICNGHIFKTVEKQKKHIVPVVTEILTPKDKPMLESIYEDWSELTKYGGQLIQGYLRRIKHKTCLERNQSSLNYLILRLQGIENIPADEPLAMAEISRWNKTLCVELLQASDRVCYPQTNRLSGCGEMLMYAIAKLAKTIDAPEIKITSTNDGFYKKIFRLPSINQKDEFITITRRDINRFLLASKRKYDLLDDADTISKKQLNALEKNCYPVEIPKGMSK